MSGGHWDDFERSHIINSESAVQVFWPVRDKILAQAEFTSAEHVKFKGVPTEGEAFRGVGAHILDIIEHLEK